jgi:hypothetical protein
MDPTLRAILTDYFNVNVELQRLREYVAELERRLSISGATIGDPRDEQEHPH